MEGVQKFLIKNWYLEECAGKEFVLWGEIYRNDQICQHIKINTSPIRQIEVENNVLTLHTKNSSYRVKMEEYYNQLMDFRSALTYFGYSKKDINELVICKAKALRQDMERMRKKCHLPDQCVFIAIDTIKDYSRVKAYAYVNGAGRPLASEFHKGEFQNTVTISGKMDLGGKNGPEQVEIQYLPREFAVIFHEWNVNVPVYLYNPDEFTIQVNMEEAIYRLRGGEGVLVRNEK